MNYTLTNLKIDNHKCSTEWLISLKVLFTFFLLKLLLNLLITMLAHLPIWAIHQHHQPDTHLFQKQCLEMMKLQGNLGKLFFIVAQQALVSTL